MNALAEFLHSLFVLQSAAKSVVDFVACTGDDESSGASLRIKVEALHVWRLHVCNVTECRS
jgi:hypothetical protein